MTWVTIFTRLGPLKAIIRSRISCHPFVPIKTAPCNHDIDDSLEASDSSQKWCENFPATTIASLSMLRSAVGMKHARGVSSPIFVRGCATWGSRTPPFDKAHQRRNFDPVLRLLFFRSAPSKFPYKRSTH